jgi:hypothetical protein
MASLSNQIDLEGYNEREVFSQLYNLLKFQINSVGKCYVNSKD